MEIIKNGKEYFYSMPPEYIKGYDYHKLIDILSDLDIEIARSGRKYCYVFSPKKILTKLKKYFKNVEHNSYDKRDKLHCYMITLLSDEEFEKIYHPEGYDYDS